MTMPKHEVSFDLQDPSVIDFPAHLLEQGGRYIVKVVRGGSVDIVGNRDGLLYLAELLVRLALGERVRGFHVHLDFDSNTEGPNVDLRPELTFIFDDEL